MKEIANSNPSRTGAVSNFRPEFIALPARGGDACCNLSRSAWYEMEARGLIQLIRIRKPGCTRGRTLLPCAAAVALLRRLGAQTAKADQKSSNSKAHSAAARL